MSLETNLAALPEYCYATLPSDGSLILIKREVTGYHPCEGYQTNDLFPTFADVANMLNDHVGITRAQRMAMESGSIFGWDLPIADPAVHETAALIEQVKEVPGTEEIVQEIFAMRRLRKSADEIRERFARIMDTARPDLVAKFKATEAA